MKTEKRDRPNPAWEKQKERARVIERYLKVGGSYIVAHPVGHRNYQERRDDAKRSRRIRRALNKATRTGRDPMKVLRRFGQQPKPMQPRPPFTPKQPKQGFLGKVKNFFQRGDR